jgi:S-DNA-T family DNA segregation ATPase FtsK/SpoIIIE
LPVRQASVFHRLPIAVIAAVAALLMLSLILQTIAAAAPNTFLSTGALTEALLLPGRFLFTTFSWAAYYIPIYLFLNAWVLGRFSSRRMVILMLTLAPFITAALLFKVIFDDGLSASPVVVGLKAFLGTAGSIIGLSAYTLAEILMIAAIARYLGRKVRAVKAAEKKVSLKPVVVKEKRFLLPEPEKADGNGNGKNNGNGKGALKKIEPERVEPEAEALSSDAAEADDMEAAVSRVRVNADDDDEDNESVAAEASGAGEADGRGPAESRKTKKAPAVLERRPKTRGKYRIKVESVLKDYGRDDYAKLDSMTQRLSETLKATLEEFNIQAEVTGIQKGPVITMFEILPAPGVKLSKIVNLADNIALRLAASRVRIVAPIPGKQAVGIEVPNKRRSIVSLRETITDPAFTDTDRGLPIALGKDIMGNVQIADLTQMPHLLIAGATGSGKSVCVNSIICSLLFSRSPEEVRLLLIDPKIVELKYFNDIPHLLTPVITEPKKAYQALQYCIAEMERRYALLDALCVRDIKSFNVKAAKKTHTTDPLPHIVVVIDEFADLIAVTGKDMESTLARLAAMSRAVGIHIVLATQRPSIDVITGLIKANIPARIAFMVAGKFDSRIIIDQVGAEKLLGQGDMLFLSSQNPFPVRIQGAFISDSEVEDLVAEVKTYGEPDYIDDEIFIEEEGDFDIGLGEADPLFDRALDVVIAAGKASTSYVQRKLKIGYNRAARLVEELEIRGIVGPANGSKAREVIHVPSKPRE